MLAFSLGLFFLTVGPQQASKQAADEDEDSDDEVQPQEKSDQRTERCWFSELLRKKQRAQEGLMLSFADPEMEKAWVLESLPKNMQQGGALMAAMSAGLLINRLAYMQWRLSCPHVLYEETTPDAVFLISLTLALLASVDLAWRKLPARRGVTWRHSITYWGVMLFLWAAFLVTSIPPFSPFCVQLCNDEEQCPDLFRVRAKKLDCTLQGHTACQILMLFLLSLPFALPQFYHQYLALFWLFCVYLSATLLYERAYDNRIEGLHHKDIPLHCGLLLMAWSFSATRKYYLERSMRRQYIGGLKQRQAMARLYYMFKEMVPEYLIPRMLEGETIADPVSPVTVLFVLIDNFNEFSSRKQPDELLQFLNDYFREMDDICRKHKVTKIETVAEEYVACVGVTPSDQEVNNDPGRGHSVLLDGLLKASEEILALQEKVVQGDRVKFKMGLHTGDIVAGVIGSKLPRFRLFGNTINTAARMMQKGEPGTVQFGLETRKWVRDELVKERGEVEMKGKGKVQCFVLKPKEERSGSTQEADAKKPSSSRRSSISQILQGEQDSVEYSESWREAVQGYMDSSDAGDYLVLDSGGEVVPWEQTSFLAKPEIFPLKVVRKNDDEFDKIMDAQLSVDASKLKGKEKKEWFCWWHQKAVCRSFALRQNILTLLIAISSLGEILHMEQIRGWENNDSSNSLLHLKGRERFRTFLAFRVTCFLMSAGWSLVAMKTKWLEEGEVDPDDEEDARTRRKNALYAKAWTVQLALIATKVVLSVLIWLSYNVLVLHRMKKSYIELGPLEYLNQQFSLVFIVAFFIIMNIHPLTFQNSLAFIPLACMFMALRDHTPLYVSGVGRVVFVSTAILTSILAYLGEQSSRGLFKSKKKVKESTRRIHGILQTLMPAEVLETLHKLGPGRTPSHHYNQATITQSDLCGFTQLSSTKTPHEVVGFMGDLFGRFDALASEFGIYKVETVGDAYIAGMAWVTGENGAPLQKLTEKNSTLQVVKFGLAMIKATADWDEGMKIKKLVEPNVRVTCRVGVHHGQCIGGIVGTGMMRYHLFGQFMGQVDILEATSREGQCQISRACMEKVWQEAGKDALSYEERGKKEGQPELQTSKGEVHYFEEVGGAPTYLVEASLVSRVKGLEEDVWHFKQHLTQLERLIPGNRNDDEMDEDWDWDTRGRDI